MRVNLANQCVHSSLLLFLFIDSTLDVKLQASTDTNVATNLCCRFALPLFIFADYIEAAFWPKPKPHLVCIPHFNILKSLIACKTLIFV